MGEYKQNVFPLFKIRLLDGFDSLNNWIVEQLKSLSFLRAAAHDQTENNKYNKYYGIRALVFKDNSNNLNNCTVKEGIKYNK